jgi:aspartyl-tRNA synthetase
LLQIVVNETFAKPELLKNIGKETVLAVSGQVVKRAKANPDLPSGKVEVIAANIEILATAEVPPFVPENRGNVASSTAISTCATWLCSRISSCAPRSTC